MGDRRRVLIGVLVGTVWSVALLAGAAIYVTIPVFALIPTIMTAFLAPGLVMAAMIGSISSRRFITGQFSGELSEAGEIDRVVLHNTMEQLVIAAAIWPAAAVLLGPYGPGVIIALGVSFAIARLVFWYGSHRGRTVRAAGFAATFFPTVFVAAWSLGALIF